MLLRQLALGAGLALLCACNMVISEKPMFAETDRGNLVPRDGIWLSEDDECRFDRKRPDSEWPQCALWVVARNSGSELEISDGKGQSQRLGSLFVAGTPAVVEARWVDDAKPGADPIYGYYGLEPGPVARDGQFTVASAWPVECGTQEAGSSKIEPFAGITAECRPTSKQAIRAAAVASRRSEQVQTWRWLRPEAR